MQEKKEGWEPSHGQSCTLRARGPWHNPKMHHPVNSKYNNTNPGLLQVAHKCTPKLLHVARARAPGAMSISTARQPQIIIQIGRKVREWPASSKNIKWV